MARATLAAIGARTVPKGDTLEVAKVAAIQAVKNTASIIPYCHPILVEFAGVGYRMEEDGIVVQVTVKAVARTGVEMEALTGASVAALTLYDMLKMLDDTMAIGEVRMLEKRGGKSDFSGAAAPGLRAAVVVLSDSVAAGRADDTAGRLITERLRALGIEAPEPVVLPDDRRAIADRLRGLADGDGVDLVVSTGGTGLGAAVLHQARQELFERGAVLPERAQRRDLVRLGIEDHDADLVLVPELAPVPELIRTPELILVPEPGSLSLLALGLLCLARRRSGCVLRGV